jgi:CheY-like chemotaxis protein
MIPDGGNTPKYVAVTEQDASRFYAEKFARFALQIDPQNKAYRQLWIVACFDLVGNKLGSDNPVKIDPSLIDSVRNNYTELEIESALTMAMQHDRPMAARVAVELLGHIGSAETLIHQRGSSQSALVRAAGFSDRRVRFAALASIMNLDPQRQYPGSSVVSESLVFFTRGTGVKRAIVAAPWIGDAKTIAGLLEQKALGYKPVVTTTGRQAMQLAIDSADTELMMLDSRIPNPDVGFLIQDMRADNRTHNVPIGIMAAVGEISRAERVTFGNKISRACSKPIDEEMAKFIVDNLLRETGVELIPPEIRLAEARQSILWVAQLYERSTIYRFENIEQVAFNTLWEPELASETLQLVRLIPSQRDTAGIPPPSVPPTGRPPEAVYPL